MSICKPFRWTALLLAIALVGCSLRSPTMRGMKPGETTVTVNPSGESFDPAAMSQQSPLSPESSVNMPEATSPVPASAYAQKPTIGSRIREAATVARDAVAIKPREIPAEDPISLNSKPGPLGASVYISAAKIYENQGNESQAIEQYRKALIAEPSNHDATIGLARLHHRGGRLEKAITLYQEAISAHPNSAVASNDLALCYVRQGETTNAIDALKRAVEIDPASKRYRNNLARILVDNQRYDEALVHLKSAHGEAIGYYNLGYLLHQQGQNELALPYFAEAARRDSSLTAARQMLAKLKPVQPLHQEELAAATQVGNRRDAAISISEPSETRLPTVTRSYPASTSVNLSIGDTPTNRIATVSSATSKLPVVTNAELRRMPPTESHQEAPTPGEVPDYLQN